ncbi:hypothetical protein [Anaerosphaera multitolerans]|uniref:hypothetical protein n=1 Tax=Anaerosphaera multitolerans TaxID=2487351 RepID=UPI0013E3E445|nr:hypothetical protein [Anaerosphaera multitolerans]
MENYGLNKSDTYRILHHEDCPIITGGDGRKFLVEKEAFENFLRRKDVTSVRGA